VTDFGGAIKKSKEFDVALLGVPFDEKSCYLRGAALGPQAIRAASTSKAINAWTEYGVDLEKETTWVDLGDVDVTGEFFEVFSRIETSVLDILERNAIPVVIGGDHSITYPIVKAFAKKFDSLDVLHFDAHPDLYDELYGDRYSHACPFARIAQERLVQNIVQVGLRAVTGEHREKARIHDIQMIEMKDIQDIPVLRFSNPLYISFDIDALDPAFAPGVSHHEPGGLSTRQAIKIIHALEAEIVGMDVVEVNPQQDQNGITAAAAVKIIMEILGKTILMKK